jgi:hypothetical protein
MFLQPNEPTQLAEDMSIRAGETELVGKTTDHKPTCSHKN